MKFSRKFIVYCKDSKRLSPRWNIFPKYVIKLCCFYQYWYGWEKKTFSDSLKKTIANISLLFGLTKAILRQ